MWVYKASFFVVLVATLATLFLYSLQNSYEAVYFVDHQEETLYLPIAQPYYVDFTIESNYPLRRNYTYFVIHNGQLIDSKSLFIGPYGAQNISVEFIPFQQTENFNKLTIVLRSRNGETQIYRWVRVTGYDVDCTVQDESRILNHIFLCELSNSLRDETYKFSFQPLTIAQLKTSFSQIETYWDNETLKVDEFNETILLKQKVLFRDDFTIKVSREAPKATDELIKLRSRSPVEPLTILYTFEFTDAQQFKAFAHAEIIVDFILNRSLEVTAENITEGDDVNVTYSVINAGNIALAGYLSIDPGISSSRTNLFTSDVNKPYFLPPNSKAWFEFSKKDY